MMSDWEQTTFKLLAEMQLERVIALAEWLLAEYRQRNFPISKEEVKGLKQREIVELIATRNGDVFVAKEGVPIMKELNVFGNPANAYPVVYRILNRPGGKFEKVAPGIYRLNRSVPPAQPRRTLTPRIWTAEELLSLLDRSN